jgi:hypothetical protein
MHAPLTGHRGQVDGREQLVIGHRPPANAAVFARAEDISAAGVVMGGQCERPPGMSHRGIQSFDRIGRQQTNGAVLGRGD